MTHTYTLERRQLIRRPLDEVFAFFADAGNLEAITPEFLQFRILTPRPIAMQPGALIDYRLKLLCVPLQWRTRIEEFEPPRRFVDVQLGGPYKLWRHTHEFTETAEGTVVLDRIAYQIPLGPLGRLAHAIFVRHTLNQIFDHRHRIIERLLPPTQAGGVGTPVPPL